MRIGAQLARTCLLACLLSSPVCWSSLRAKRGGEGEFRSPERIRRINTICAFYIAFIHDVQAPDEMTLLYNLNDPQVNLPALMTDEAEQCRCNRADGVEDQGRRLQRNRHRYGPSS